MALTNVPANAPIIGWRSWALVLENGSPRLMGHSYLQGAPGHEIPPRVPGDSTPRHFPIPPGQTPIPYPDAGDYGGFVWHAGINEALPPTNANWPWESALYGAPGPEGPEVAPRQFGRMTGAWGRAEYWGWTSDQPGHWTSQFARVLEIFVDSFHADRVATLAAYYGVPVAVG